MLQVMDCVYEFIADAAMEVKEGWSHWHLKFNPGNGAFFSSTIQGVLETSEKSSVKNLRAERI